ncbi:MAG: nitrite/sulfite reductase [Bryobacter sp.]|nr:nitrite/sulfite reductase [Bryobacter sp.]
MALSTAPSVEEQFDQTVVQDIALFRSQVEDFLAGRLTDDEFRAFRLRRGVYGQRQPNVHMIRTKIPGGLASAKQFEMLADIADKYASGRGHLTTRQNMQYHFIPLPRVPDLLLELGSVRLTTREACYNTVRNVTGDTLAGIAADEVFDISPYLRQVAYAFLHKELTDSLPRKFKISFSATPGDTMQGGLHDLGFIARIVDGQRGFRVLAAGGLGPLPCEAGVLDDFLPADKIVNRAEAVIRVFNKYGNRKNKHKARLKFIIRERGWDWFVEHVEQEYADILANGGIAVPLEVPRDFGAYSPEGLQLGKGELPPVLPERAPEYQAWLASNVKPQRQPGYAIVTVKIPQGNMTSAEMRAVADVARRAGDGLVRVTIEQNLVLAWIPQARLAEVHGALAEAGLAEAGANEIEDVVTCPGAWSCNLGITKTMNLGEALSTLVKNYRDPLVRKLSIKASGCPNSCGQHWIGDLGFFGNVRKMNGAEVPYYQMLLGGGKDRDGLLKYGFTVHSIPAKSVPVAVQRVLAHYQENRVEGETFREYVLRFRIETFRGLVADLVKPMDLEPDAYKDWGDDEKFSLQLGRAECAA